MPFDVFHLRDRVVQEYRDYVESFVHVLDPRIDDFVRERLAKGELWPEAVLQLNPAYEPGPTLGELAASGAITADTARFFGSGLRLHRHQAEAIAAAGRGEDYMVSTGTGSGKSLTYLVPIFDAILRDDPARHSVRALIVYPMNALINSQIDAFNTFRADNWPACPVRFAQYTGQTREEVCQQLLQEPPHVLLTNYVMLEYMLIRPQERALVGETTRELRFLAVDELHVYRGRQGADVAMLLCRQRQRAGRPNLLCAGTSATIATGGDRTTRRAQIAEVGNRRKSGRLSWVRDKVSAPGGLEYRDWYISKDLAPVSSLRNTSGREPVAMCSLMPSQSLSCGRSRRSDLCTNWRTRGHQSIARMSKIPLRSGGNSARAPYPSW